MAWLWRCADICSQDNCSLDKFMLTPLSKCHEYSVQPALERRRNFKWLCEHLSDFYLVVWAFVRESTMACHYGMTRRDVARHYCCIMLVIPSVYYTHNKLLSAVYRWPAWWTRHCCQVQCRTRKRRHRSDVAGQAASEFSERRGIIIW